MINRLGFNNKGVDHLVRQVKKRTYSGILGINIGKNADTPFENAVDDYLQCLDKVYEHADYITVNISSPNTSGLRDLQAEDTLNALLLKLLSRRDRLADDFKRRVPLLVKIAPDLDEKSVERMAGVFNAHKLDGLIATNTTIDREAIIDSKYASESGGLSGSPLLTRANNILGAFHEALDSTIPLIGVGGICKPRDAAAKFELGANLVQFYTGFIYAGPDLIRGCIDAVRPIVKQRQV